MEENFRILKPYLRGLPLIILSMTVAVIAAKKYLNYVTPMYESTVKLKLADINEGVPSSNLFKNLDVFASANKIAEEIEVMKSSMLLNRVLDSVKFDLEIRRTGQMRKVELFEESPFFIQYTFNNSKAYDKIYGVLVTSPEGFTLQLPDGLGVVNGRFNAPVTFKYGAVTISLNQELIHQKPGFKLIDRYEFEVLSREQTLARVTKNLDVISIDKDVAVVRINYKSPVPEKAALLVNRIAETYINDYIQTKYRAAHTTVNFLNDRINDISRKLIASEMDIQRYRDNKAITNIRQQTETDMREISQLKILQTNLKMNLDAINMLYEYVEKGKADFLELAPNFEAFTDLLSTEIIKKIKQLQADKKDMLLIFTTEDARVKIIDEKIKDLTSYLVESIGNTRKNLQVKYDRLSRDIEESEKVFIGIPEKERMLTVLNREFEIYQQSYNFLNEKKIEAEIAEAAKIAFHRVISPATTSDTPVSPNRAIITIVSALAAMFGAIALIFVVHAVKAKVNDAYTIEQQSNIPLAVATPRLPDPALALRHFQREAIQLEIKGILKPADTVTITSGSAGEGKSYHALYLARALARQGRKVLIGDVAGTPAAYGLQSAPETTPVPSGIEGVAYVSLPPARFAQFTKPALAACLEHLKTGYDVMLIANEPIEKETVALLFMSVANTNLFVLDSRLTGQKQIAQTSVLHKEFSLPNLWFVLNRAGYNPSILIQAWTLVSSVVNRIKKR